ncbi:hypothetical protein QJS10_CPB19g01609 [Acorus calamus]|uniref:Protein XRI1 n=1 Tax=Acorus calamus TaxID=4465 RepID=A0AAV9CKJ1_ACOCL|nr:hypothetical protein QJS10_CPB19g01609 [Acorus calamus]
MVDWDIHSFGVGALIDNNMSLDNYCKPAFMSEFSTGYLEDALVEWKYKRRRTDDPDVLLHEYWNSDFLGNPLVDFDFFAHNDADLISGDQLNSSTTVEISLEGAPSMETLPENIEKISDSLSEEHKVKKDGMASKDTPTSESFLKKKKKAIMGLAYPFAVVKPGGIDGIVTLDDINRRLLMPPTRSVPHPVGEFSRGPLVSSAHGPGLSGKQVVGLTKIHTQGTGTITIIRTRG